MADCERIRSRVEPGQRLLWDRHSVRRHASGRRQRRLARASHCVAAFHCGLRTCPVRSAFVRASLVAAWYDALVSMEWLRSRCVVALPSFTLCVLADHVVECLGSVGGWGLGWEDGAALLSAADQSGLGRLQQTAAGCGRRGLSLVIEAQLFVVQRGQRKLCGRLGACMSTASVTRDMGRGDRVQRVSGRERERMGVAVARP